MNIQGNICGTMIGTGIAVTLIILIGQLTQIETDVLNILGFTIGITCGLLGSKLGERYL